MKKANLIFFLLLVFSTTVLAQNENFEIRIIQDYFLATSPSGDVASKIAQNQTFEIKIIQDSIVYKADENNTVLLHKRPFKIQIELKNIEGVYLFASLHDTIYKLKDSKQIPDFKNIPSMSMAEETYNANQELIISNDGWAYWFYKPTDNWHRMDKEVIVTKSSITISKTIKQFYFSASEDEVSIENNKKQLYLFFFSAKQNENSELVNELQRYRLKINWLL